MRYLSLFSGIEAASAAWARLGWVCAGVAEIESFPSNVLAQRHPGVPNLGDITKITESDIAMLGGIDLVVFGSPCQDLSVAGKRKGLDGARSGLFFTAMQIVGWARIWGGCRFALWENVPGAFSSNKGADFGVVVGQMAGVQTVETPPKGWGTEGAIVGSEGMVEWSTLDAQWFGVAQRRRRVFAVADFGDWASRPPILLEPESLRGDSAPSRETGQSAARTLASRIGAGSYPGTDEAGTGHVVACLDASYARLQGASDQDANHGHSHLIPIGLQRPVLEPARVPPIAMCLNAGGMGRIDYETETFIVCEEVSPTLLSGSASPAAHGKKNGTDREALVIAIGTDTYNGQITGDVAATLSRQSGDGVSSGPSVMVLPFDTTQVTSAANVSNPKWGDPCHPLAAGMHPPTIAFNSNAQPDEMKFDAQLSAPLTCSQYSAIAYSTKLHNTSSNQAGKIYEEYTVALDRSSPPPALLTAMAVRRLTPRECERLQAFPDDHTLITVRGKPAADGPRYKALGNSMCVNVMHWIGKQIDHVALFY